MSKVTHRILVGVVVALTFGCGPDDSPIEVTSVRQAQDQSPGDPLGATGTAIFEPMVLEVSEDGTVATFSVRLDQAPDDTVTISFNVTDESEIALNIQTMELDPYNWDAPQLVEVRGLEDNLPDGTPGVWIEIPAMESLDRRFAHGDPEDVLVYNFDNDSTSGRRFVQQPPNSNPPNREVEPPKNGPDLQIE